MKLKVSNDLQIRKVILFFVEEYWRGFEEWRE